MGIYWLSRLPYAHTETAFSPGDRKSVHCDEISPPAPSGYQNFAVRGGHQACPSFCCVGVCCHINQLFYSDRHPVNPNSVLLLPPREIHVPWSQITTAETTAHEQSPQQAKQQKDGKPWKQEINVRKQVRKEKYTIQDKKTNESNEEIHAKRRKRRQWVHVKY